MQTGASEGFQDQRQISPETVDVDQSPWSWWRQQMPISRQWAYFDHAAVAPLSGPAAEAIRRWTAQAVDLGDTVWPQWATSCDQLRRTAAELIGADWREITLVPNTTSGINLVADGWPWRPGDNVVIPAGEFPSNLYPWLNQRDRGVEVRVVDRRDGQVLVDDLIDRVDERTQIIAVSWVGYASGFRVDIESLVEQAHRRGVAVFLDAIQGLGIFPLDVSSVPVDFLAADGHKWLLGPEGAGVAMIRRQHWNKIRPTNVGWASVKNSHNYSDPVFQLSDGASRFESGSANMVGAVALLASLEMFRQVRRTHGDTAIGDRVLHSTRQLDQLLRQVGAVTRLPIDPMHQSGILTFEVPGVEPAEIRRQAMERKVVLSCRDGGVRASVHAYNDQQDLQRLADVVRECSGQPSQKDETDRTGTENTE